MRKHGAAGGHKLYLAPGKPALIKGKYSPKRISKGNGR
jgi:hypothetical protein